MTPLTRSWLRRIALGLPLVITPVVSPLLLGVSACGACGTIDRTFAIDGAQAAQILDMQGRTTSQGCRTVCAQIVSGATDASRPDGSAADGSAADGSAADGSAADGSAADGGVYGFSSTAAGSCDVISNGGALEVTCHFTTNCVGGRRPAGLVGSELLARASAGAWLARMAWMESASVDAFELLARELSTLMAPSDLVRDAMAAAGDERRHAAAIAGLARARGFEPAAPRLETSRPRSLRALAIDNAIEGGVRETFGALLAAHQASAASDADVRETMRSIARDEARHALLSARIDAWAKTRMDASVLDDARRVAAAELARSMVDECDECDECDAAALGLPPVEAQRALVLALA